MDLKDAARRAGLTGAQIARRFGIGKATASRWLGRQTPVPSRYVKEFATLLKISPDDVLPTVVGE